MPRRAELDEIAEAHVAAAESAVRERGFLPTAKLLNERLSTRAQSALLVALEKRGLERTAKGVRVPLGKQLTRALEAARELPINVKLAGASAKEIKSAAYALVREGRAALIKKGRAERLLPADSRVLSASEASAFAEAATRLTALAKKLEAFARTARPTRTRPGYALMRDEARALADEASKALDSVADGRSQGDNHHEARALVFEAAQNLVMEGIGLVYVPELVQSLANKLVREEVHQVLSDAAQRGELELRPESGLDRLSPGDRAACLVGPSGRLVSYVRMR